MSQTSSRPRDGLLRDRQDDGTDFTELVALRDFLNVNLPTLSDKQQAVLRAFLSGARLDELAQAEGVTNRAITKRIREAVNTLREKFLADVP